jgi:hypothetical protein
MTNGRCRLRYLKGRLLCQGCGLTWYGTWTTAAPSLICHSCGSPYVIPVGPQIRADQVVPSMDALRFEVDKDRVRRGRS